eukprot:scaffold8319_cov211-Ochromonas_danica.AAC.5
MMRYSPILFYSILSLQHYLAGVQTSRPRGSGPSHHRLTLLLTRLSSFTTLLGKDYCVVVVVAAARNNLREGRKEEVVLEEEMRRCLL